MVWIRNQKIAAAGATAVILLITGALLWLGGCTLVKRFSATQTPPPTQVPAGPLTSPFTGKRVHSLKPVLAVKIDNIVFARPQTGLTKADIVYVLPVEGGLSRFLAVFSSTVPNVIGPVRSAREDDLELLRQFGRPAFAYSGATPTLLPVIEHAHTVDLYAGTHSGFYRDFSRIAPYNLYANGKQLAAQAHGASRAHDIGFRFGPPPPGGRPIGSVPVSYQSASFTFTWSHGRHCWRVSMDGAPARSTDGGRLCPPTVVIQHTVVRTSVFKEYGFRPPYAVSRGSGQAVVLRDGKAWQTTWSRPVVRGGTTYTTRSGQPMTFSVGQVWVVLTR